MAHGIRGGSSESGGPSAPEPPYGHGAQRPEQASDTFERNASSPAPPPGAPFATGDYVADGIAGSSASDPMHEYRETVEDRIDAWRKQQQQMQQTRTAADAASVVDDQGSIKLFTTVSRASVSIFFFILMWRTVHHYELADASFRSGASSGLGGRTTLRSALSRTVVVTPLVVLFLGEMIGAVLGLTGGAEGLSSASRATKKRLKGILNLHKGIELVMICYNIVRLAIWPSRYVPREIYIGRIISNFFFLMQAQLYTKLNWDEVKGSTIGDASYVTESYYDDYMPEIVENWGEGFSFSGSSVPDGDGYYGQVAPPLQPQQQKHQQQQPSFGNNSSGWRQ